MVLILDEGVRSGVDELARESEGKQGRKVIASFFHVLLCGLLLPVGPDLELVFLPQMV